MDLMTFANSPTLYAKKGVAGTYLNVSGLPKGTSVDFKILGGAVCNGFECWDEVDGKKVPRRFPIDQQRKAIAASAGGEAPKEFVAIHAFSFGVKPKTDITKDAFLKGPVIMVFTQRSLVARLKHLIKEVNGDCADCVFLLRKEARAGGTSEKDVAYSLELREEGFGDDVRILRRKLSAEDQELIPEEPVNLDALFENEDPFAAISSAKESCVEEAVVEPIEDVRPALNKGPGQVERRALIKGIEACGPEFVSDALKSFKAGSLEDLEPSVIRHLYELAVKGAEPIKRARGAAV